MGNHYMKGGSEFPLTDQCSRLEQWSIIISLEQKSCQVFSRLSGKETIMVADIEELEQMDAPELHAIRLNEKEVLTTQRSGNFKFPVVDGTIKIFGGDRRLRTSTSIRDRPERREEQEIIRGDSDGLSSPNPLQDDSTLDDAEVKNGFWAITEEFTCRHHVVPRVKLYVPREESFPIPSKYIDVTRTTYTSLDVMLENR